MKYIKLFENFSNNDWKKNILEKTDILQILEDLQYISMENLDIKVGDDEGNYLDKALIFDVMIENSNGYLDTILNGRYAYDQDKPMTEYFDWNDELSYELNNLPNLINNGDLKMIINFAIVVKTFEDSDEIQLADGNNDIYNRISKIYDDVEFDIINPWDLY